MGRLLSRAHLTPARAVFKAARQLVFPDQCPQCGTLVEGEGGLCGPCWRETHFIFGLVCDQCGIPMIGPDDGYRVTCDACRALDRPWQRGRAALVYRGGARRMVLGLKHGDRLDLAPILAGWMADRAGPLDAEGALIVPVPLHRARLFRRRYNQSAVLARLVARRLGHAHLPDALQRVRATAPLESGGFAERHAEISPAITLNPARRDRLKNRPVILIDDVMTTGATLTACTRALMDADVSGVNILALARAPQRG